MVDRENILAIIPARGGSKSIPGKNIRQFAGYPLIAYSIAAGLQASSVSRVIVSTDDDETASIAKKFGAEVPFMRPPELARDTTPDLPVFEHALRWLADRESFQPDLVVQLRPTTPLRPKDCIDRGVELLRTNPQADSVRAVVPSGQNPYKMWRIAESGAMKPLLNASILEPYNQPRQRLPETFWQSGHMDVIRASVILEKGSMSGEVILPLVLDPKYSVDIDTPLDWERAEWKLNQGAFDVVLPGANKRPFPEKVGLVVLDFDGVMTDNRVWTDVEGNEWVAANRSDGLGVAKLKQLGIEVVVLSTENNPVVAARSKKLGLEVHQAIEDKGSKLKELLEKRPNLAGAVVYLGNDINDLECFPLVDCALVVADAHSKARAKADLILAHKGGFGAVRELCDMIEKGA